MIRVRWMTTTLEKKSMHKTSTSWSERLQTLLEQQKNATTTTANSNKNIIDGSILLPALLWRHHNNATTTDPCVIWPKSPPQQHLTIYDCGVDQVEILNSVFIGGSQYTKQHILEHLKAVYTWIEVSNISFQLLYTKYNKNLDLVLNHLFNGRTEPKIYVLSDQELQLYQQVLTKVYDYNHENDHETTPSQQITPQFIQTVYNDCCDCLQESSMSRIVMVIDCRWKYFAQRPVNTQNRLYLQTASYAAIMSKRHLHPFIEFILVKDTETEEKYTTNSNDDCSNNVYKYLVSLINQAEQPIDTTLYSFDVVTISAIVARAYKSTF